MTGLEVKEKLVSLGFKLTDIAQNMNISPQSLHKFLLTEDIKTGVLEKIAKAIGKDILYFYNAETNISNLDESQLAIEITENSGKASRLYEKIVSIDKLLDLKFGIKDEGGYATGAAKILNDTFFKKYDFAFYRMTYEQKKQFNDQLKKAIDSFQNIFFERFKILSKQLDTYPNH